AGNHAARHFEGEVAGKQNAWVRCSFSAGRWSGMAAVDGGLFKFSVSNEDVESIKSNPDLVLDSVLKARLSLVRVTGESAEKLFFHGSLIPQMPAVDNADKVGVNKKTKQLNRITRDAILGGTVGNELIRLDLELFLDHFFIDYANSLQLNPADTASAMVNIVDGIYRGDLGIRFNLVSISGDANPAQPILSETNDADALLNDLEYKKNAGLLFNQGDQKIGHLITSRSRDQGLILSGYSGVVGLSYSRSALNEAPLLCSASALGFSLAYLPQDKTPQDLASLTALTMAHEIAHNLGAIHDGTTAPGYVSNTCDPTKYIMAAQENSARHFSACSKQEIDDEVVRVRQRVENGYVQNCLIDLVDLDLTLASSYSAYHSIGSNDSRQIQLLNRSSVSVSQLNFSGSISNASGKFLGVTASNSTCTLVDDQHYQCQTPSLAAYSQINIVEQIEYRSLGESSVSLRIDSFSSAVGSEDIDNQDVLNSDISVLDISAPAEPSDVTLTRIDSGVEVRWRDNSDVEEHFVLERQTNGGDFVVISSALDANTTSYVDTDANNRNSEYVYRVSAINRIGRSAPATSSILYGVSDSGGGGGVVDMAFVSVLLIFLFVRRQFLCELDH
ncbi:MAG TPA: M12 family metallo-peptidase, partial [Pseudomonadales bacterium]|nr:M12 family metallo-peptidase [Pseudomonadales bacterium]